MASLAAILAMGKPVAFDANALERLTRGFISMTTMRPFADRWRTGCSTRPSPRRSRASRRSRRPHPLVFLVGERLGGGHGDRVAVWTPMGSKFSIEQMMTTLSSASRITSISYSFQPITDSSSSTWWTGEASRPWATRSSNSARL